MNTSTPIRGLRKPARIVAIAAALAGTLIATACGEEPNAEAQPAASSSRAVAARQYYYDITHPAPAQDALITASIERRRLADIVSKMPAGWAATEAMRRSLEAP